MLLPRYHSRFIPFLLMGYLFVLLSACVGGEETVDDNPNPTPETTAPTDTTTPITNSPQVHACLQGSWLAVSQNQKNSNGSFNNPLFTPPIPTPEVNIIIGGLLNPAANSDSSVDVYTGSDVRIWQYDSGFFQDTYSNDWSILLTSKTAGTVDGFFTTKNMCTHIYQASARNDALPSCDVNQLYDDESEIILDCTKNPATMTLHSAVYSVNYQRVSDAANVLSPVAIIPPINTDDPVIDPEPKPKPKPEPEPSTDDVLSGFDQATSAQASWAPASDRVLSGNHSLKSADISGSESAAIVIDGEFLAGTISFFYRVSSEENYDYFNFYLDNQLVITISGTHDWSEFSQSLSQGYHSFKWEYKKDQSSSHGDDAAWIDQVQLPPTNQLPVAPLSLPVYKQNISASNNHYHAIRSDGSVWSWGFNYQGFIGDGTSGSDAVTVPVKVHLSGKAVAVNSYDGHVLALMDDGTVWAWGSNSRGQLGDGNDGDDISGGALFHNPTPVQVIGLSDIVQIATGNRHSVALSRDGRVWTWGDNSSGQLGLGNKGNKNRPVLVTAIDQVVEVAAGLFNTLLVRQDGTVWIFGGSSSGTNTYSTLGIEGVFQSLLPVQVPTLNNVVHIAHGGAHQFAIKADGSVWAWGTNIYGRLGDGGTANTTTPVELSTLTNIKSLSTQAATSMALSHDGEVWVWGNNDYQGLCTELAGKHHSPVQMPISDVIEIAAGFDGYLLLTQAGELLACGSNSYGSLGTGEPYNRVSSLKNVGDEFGSGTFSFHGDSDQDGVRDDVDAFPDDPNETLDNDGDGIGNNSDGDDDNDGVLDINDAFPLDANETLDTDADGTGNNSDNDDDGDGVLDVNDAFPLDASETLDTDANGIGDNSDTDDDGDGILDVNDAFPLDPLRYYVNTNPVISGTPNSNINQDVLYSYTPIVTDPDLNETTVFSITNQPIWASFNTSTGSLSGTPNNSHVGSYSNISITVSDLFAGTDSITFSIVVNNINDGPVLTGIPVSTVNEDSYYSFSPTLTDVDVNDSHYFSIINQPIWSAFKPATGELMGTPLNVHVGFYDAIEITVSDANGATHSIVFSITVNNTNDAPVISGVPATSINEDTFYSFTPSVYDADSGDEHTFSISNKPTWASFNTLTGQLSGTPLVATSSENIIISVSDIELLTDDLAAFNLTVININDAPVLTSGTSVDVAENQTATGYTASASDEENNNISFTISGVDAAKFSISAGILSFVTPPNYESPSDSGGNNIYNITITATDNGSPNLSDSLALTVTVLDVNEFAPVFSSATITSRAENLTTVGYTAIASDADNDNIMFSISGGSDQNKFSIDSNTGILSFSFTPNFEAPADSDGNNIYQVNITASDDGAVSLSSTLTLTVTLKNVIEIIASDYGLKTINLDWDTHSDASYYKLFYYDQGTAALTQMGGNISTSQYEAPVYNHQWHWSNTFYVVQAYDSSNQEIPFSASDEFNISNNNGHTIGYFKASNSQVFDEFGSAVAISGDGNTLVVGAIGEDSSATTINGDQSSSAAGSSGAAYVFVKSGDNWVQQAYLKNSNTAQSDFFGYSVAISDDGDDIIVGALFANKAYIFTRVGTDWSQQAALQGLSVSSGDNFAQSVSMSDDGNRVAIGAKGKDISGTDATDGGAVYIFDRANSSWSETVELIASNYGYRHYFGSSLALSGDGLTLAVGAPGESSNSTGINPTPNGDGWYSGAIYIFNYADASWSQQAFMKASTYQADAVLGGAVSISDDGNVVAAGTKDGNTNLNTVYIFNRISGNWYEQGIPRAANEQAGDYYGWALDLDASGTQLVVSASYEDSAAKNINGDDSDEMANGAGAVYYFKYSGSSWSQHNYIKASNTNSYDYFGYSVSLSDDGNSLAVGAKGESSNATEVSTGDDTAKDNDSNDSSGAVYLY